MVTLDSLKQALRQEVKTTTSFSKQSLSDTQYSAGFNILVRGPGWTTYKEFVIPQLNQLLAPLFNSRVHISALEIGPGPKSLLGNLPGSLRQKVKKYTAFEPNGLFARRLEEWIETESPFPCLGASPNVHQVPFVLQDNIESGTNTGMMNKIETYDIILFCHSMYGMKPKHRFIEQALRMLVKRPHGGMVVVFHRDGALRLDGLVCHQTASFPTGVVSVADDDKTLDCFAPFVAGFIMQDVDVDKAIRICWRKVCRALGRREEAHPGHLLFGSPNIMMAFNQHATTLPELAAHVPLVDGDKVIKNWEARLHCPASIVRPTEVRHVQQCVRWALKHEVSLTVLGGGHSGHCLWPNVVSVDMGAFDQVHILTAGDDGEKSDPLVVAETGCKTGDIIGKTMAAGLTVPLGARPSVGAGLWLQGGIGHLARLHGLASDAIIGAVVVSVESNQVLCVGHVPRQHWPVGAVRPEDQKDLLWAIKGAGTNFGIVISVTFKAYQAPNYCIRNWVVPLSDNIEARLRLSNFNRFVASELPRNFSADAYLYWDNDQLHLGVTMFESSTSMLAFETPTSIGPILGPEDSLKTVDSLGLFDTEMYMSRMHGGHAGGKTSSFKRCLFLKSIGAVNVANTLVAAVETRPSPLCYLHLLQGGGAVGDLTADATAFGCRDWDFACVVTGVWPRDQDGTEAAQAAVRWVYNVAGQLLPLSSGSYGADLGPDPRDAALAAGAFGPNQPRLARLKRSLDPRNVLAYACPLPKAPMKQKLIILVTGESCAGKDYCAALWVAMVTHKSFTARAVSISDATKRDYAAATGTDLNRLLVDRAYKEHHRPALTAFFDSRVQQQPQLLEDHFLNVVYGAADVDVLLITGMRDEAPVATLSHLIPNSRLLEIRVTASDETRQARRECHGDNNDSDNNKENKDSNNSGSGLPALDYCPSLIFNNDSTGHGAVKSFGERYLLPFVHENLQRLTNMVSHVTDFPRPGIDFRHVLGISQQPGGLALCTTLLQTHFVGDWSKIGAVVCCEVGGFVYASALASQIDIPLVLIREAGKLPQPTVSVVKPSSYISSLESNNLEEKRFEMERDVVPKDMSVLVVDDVLSTGRTLCAVLQLLDKAGVGVEHFSVMVVAEFPVHRGRALLRQRGFGTVNIQSLLVFGGA
ncbi:phosphoribosyl transferase domain protein [Leptodontidium sp. MPI-SDFR-AT-0119]|nr:phosphoribosyl transferase domain protein [Leptodontidium sp. MPI-SDFR-AT-0119]